MTTTVVPLGHSAAIDVVDAVLSRLPQVECPVTHCFTPGLYRRSVVVPEGVLATSKIHRTEHQWILLRGSMSVWTEETGWSRVNAPYMGVTKPGTRRVGFAHVESEWVTFHATEATTPEEVEAEVIEPHDPASPRILEEVLALLQES